MMNTTRQPQHTATCQCVSGQPWACPGVLQGQLQPLQCAAGVVQPALGAKAGLGRWFVGGAVFPVYRGFQRRRRQHPATTIQRALAACEWPALSMSWGTERPNTASALCGRFGEACSWGCGRAGQVVCGGCSFAGLWRFPEEEAALSNHNAQSPASV